jgi:hypothetical protein
MDVVSPSRLHGFYWFLLKGLCMDSMFWLSLLLAPVIIALFFLIGYLAYQRKSNDALD